MANNNGKRRLVFAARRAHRLVLELYDNLAYRWRVCNIMACALSVTVTFQAFAAQACRVTRGGVTGRGRGGNA